ncbi:hypothetical protein [Planctomyces sp. SH-PL62]|uniref:hypothetical protein n=1 Tax=Planctomyces sp. SH-PL62 TaxID=1636152 RepID=UPI00078B2FF6|nr:hypothetical protein [Planctomyces sp. SH-PL62]AMV36423.1 hypothetical protein VT85_03260 [Planctomyces sp. SH-PL62]
MNVDSRVRASRELDESRPGAIIALAAWGVAMGAALGGLTNAINGRVSPEYFRAVMHWERVLDVARASVAQGIFEGLLFGLGLSMIFTSTVGMVSHARCPLRVSGKYLLAIGGAALACWVIGGLLATGLATLSPEFYREAFRAAPEEPGALIRFAWVGGSIWGLQFGGLAAVIVASVLFRAWWRSNLAYPTPA